MTLKENVEIYNLYSMFSTECKSNKKTTKGDINCELMSTTIPSHHASCLIVSEITPITPGERK
jgi:hypothetical protein